MLIGQERFDFAERTKHLAESIIRVHFPSVKRIVWTNEHPDLHSLDIDRGIDVILELRTGQPITIQVKTLSLDYKTITVEDEGVDQEGNQKSGDWSHCLAMMTLVLYSLDDGISAARYAILDNARLALATANHQITWRKCRNRFPAQSTFRWTYLSEIFEGAREAIWAFGGDWGSDLRLNITCTVSVA